MKKKVKTKVKIKEVLTAYEILELHKKQFRKSSSLRYRIPLRFDKDYTPKSSMFLLR